MNEAALAVREENLRERASLVTDSELRPLKRLGPGRYETANKRFEILKDPTGGKEPGGWGYTSWLVYDKQDPHDECLNVNGADHSPTLKDAVHNLAREICAGTFESWRACAADCGQETFEGPVCSTCFCCRACSKAYRFASGQSCPGCRLDPEPPSVPPGLAKTHPENPLNYTCSFCKAQRFKPCRLLKGKKARSPHLARRRRAWSLK